MPYSLRRKCVRKPSRVVWSPKRRSDHETQSDKPQVLAGFSDAAIGMYKYGKKPSKTAPARLRKVSVYSVVKIDSVPSELADIQKLAPIPHKDQKHNGCNVKHGRVLIAACKSHHERTEIQNTARVITDARERTAAHRLSSVKRNFTVRKTIAETCVLLSENTSACVE